MKYLIAFVFATIAILEDLRFLFDYDGCTKDNQLLAILIFLACCAISRDLVVKGFWWMLIGFKASFFLSNLYLSDFLPDTWAATEENLFGGTPVIQGSSVLAVIILCFIGYKRGQLKLFEASKCLIGSIMIIVSAQLWISGNQAIEESPWRGWNSQAKTENIVIIDSSGAFIGKPWVVSNTDFGLTMSKLKAFWASDDDQYYFVAPRIGHQHPFIYKLIRTDNKMVIIEVQARDMEWGPDMVWIWEYVLSFILVFLETLMICHTLLGLLSERNSLPGRFRRSNL